MPARPAIKIAPETAAIARRLLERRAELEQVQADGSVPDSPYEGHLRGQLYGIDNALALLWGAVLEQQGG